MQVYCSSRSNKAPKFACSAGGTSKKLRFLSAPWLCRYVSMKFTACLALLIGSIGISGCAVTSTQLADTKTVPSKSIERPKRSHQPCKTREECAKLLHQIVTNEWLMPPGSIENGHNATASIEVMSNGRVSKFTIVKSSGNEVFDRSIERALYMSEPFDELRGLSEITKNRGILLEFHFVPK